MNLIRFAKNSIQSFRLVYGLVQAEWRPKLEIPELEKLDRKDVLELVDWELKQGEEQQKMFGVGSWPLLVGLGGTVWAVASLPILSTAQTAGVSLAFVLLESTLVALRVLWSIATRTPEAFDINRAMRTSIIAGADTNASPVLSIFQCSLMLIATQCWSEPTLRLAAACVSGVLILSMTGSLLALAMFRLDVHIVTRRKSHSRKSVRVIYLTTAYLMTSISVPIIAWVWVSFLQKYPPLVDWEVAGLFVAAAYLLRKLLTSQAQARHQNFLRLLRRDLVLGFETASGAALKIAWRLSGFPTDVYVKARFQGLLKELQEYETLLKTQADQIAKALENLETANEQEKAVVCSAAQKFLKAQLRGGVAGQAGAMVNMRAELFFTFAGEEAKTSEDYRRWKSAQSEVEAAGRHYEKLYSKLELCLKEITG